MARYNTLTESKYNAIKLLLNGGATHTEAAKYMQVSEVTIYRVKQTETYTEYVNVMAAKTLAARKEREEKRKAKTIANAPAQVKAEPQTPAPQVVEHRQTVTVQATWAMMQEMQKTNKLLELISNKLAFIVEELCGTAKK